jgi:hypothetical protein
MIDGLEHAAEERAHRVQAHPLTAHTVRALSLRSHRARRARGLYASLACAMLWLVATPWAAAAQSTCGIPTLSSGQTLRCTATTAATLTVVPVAQLVLSSGSTSIAGSASGVTAATYEAGTSTGIVVTGPAFTVRSNKGVNVTMVNAPAFTSPAAKSAGDVDVSVVSGSGSCGTTWTALSTLSVAAQQASPRSLLNTVTGSAGVTGQLCFRVRWKWATDGPGGYTLPLTISVTAP